MLYGYNGSIMRVNLSQRSISVERPQEEFYRTYYGGWGFVAYYLVDAGEDIGATVSVFQDQAGAEESNRMAADWVRQHIASLVASAPEITAGEVTAYKTS